MKRVIILTIALFLFPQLYIYSQVNYHTGVVTFTNITQSSVDNYLTGPIYVLLEDADLNEDELLAETVNVSIVSSSEDSSESYIEQITLAETGVNTGVFFGQISVDEGGVVDSNGVLQVNRGDDIIVTYNDLSNDFGQPQVIKDDAIYGFTEISGETYITDITWSLSESPYLITGNVYVKNNSTLTIEPGVEVRFKKIEGNTFGIYIGDGTLEAIGTISDSIKFTVESDSPVMGDWRGINVYDSSSVSQVQIEYTSIEYAGTGITISSSGSSLVKNNSIREITTGVKISVPLLTELIVNKNSIKDINQNGFDLGSGIEINSGDTTVIISENQIEKQDSVSGYGIYIKGGEAQILNNTIRRFYYGVYLGKNGSPIISSQIKNNIINRANTGIYISGNYVQPIITYNDLDSNGYGIIINGVLEINAKNNWWGDAATAEMDAGGNPKNITYIYDYYDNNAFGFINYEGWLDGPNGNPSIGGGQTGIIEFTNITQSSVDNYPTGPIYVLLEDADLNEDELLAETVNVSIVSSSEDSSESYIEQITLAETGVNTGVFFGQISVDEGGVVDSNGVLQVNRGDDIIVTYNDLSNDFGQPQVIKDDAIYGFTEISGETYITDITWSLSESPYLITGNVYVKNNSTLTIEPGVEVRFKKIEGNTFGIYIGDGTLEAIGTISDSIKFTVESDSPVMGDWRGINVYDSSSVSQVQIEYTSIEYAGTGITISSSGSSLVKNNSIREITTGVKISVPLLTELIVNKNSIKDINQNGFDLGSGIEINSGDTTVIISENQIEKQDSVSGYGIYIKGGEAQILNNTIRRFYYGVYLGKNGSPIISSQIKNNIINRANTGIYISGNYVQPIITYNDLDSNGYGIIINGVLEINAKNNWWGDAATAEMDAGGNPKNITYIYDYYDNNAFGFINYAWWLKAETVIETKDVVAGTTNELTFEETETSLSINPSTDGSITIAKVFGTPEPSPSGLPVEVNNTTNFYFNAESNGVTFTGGKIGIPISTFGEYVDPTSLNWLKREDASQEWQPIGAELSGDGQTLLSSTTFDSFSEFTIGSNSAIISLKINIEGAYSIDNSIMNHVLNDSKQLPFVQPFEETPFNYTSGDERVNLEFYVDNEEIVDWILVELRDGGDTPETAVNIAGRLACFVKSDGTVIDEDGTTELEFFGTSPGEYFIAIHHRNHLSVMSPGKVNMTGN